MTVGITRQDYTVGQLRAQAARCKDGRVARRMLAIACVLDGAESIQNPGVRGDVG